MTQGGLELQCIPVPDYGLGAVWCGFIFSGSHFIVCHLICCREGGKNK